MMKKTAFRDLNCSFILLAVQPCKLVGDYNIKLSRPLTISFLFFVETSWVILAQ